MNENNERWAVVKSFTMREEIQPFQGCYLVTGETKNFIEIQIIKINRDGEEIVKRKVNKSNVVTYSDHDISSTVKLANDQVRESYAKHIDVVNQSIHFFRKLL